MIPIREQFLELDNAINKNIEFITQRLSFSTPFYEKERRDLPEVISEAMLQEFIKPDVELYLEQSEITQQLPAWQWLHSQQNFIRAKNRFFEWWPAQEQRGNGLEKHIAKFATNLYSSSMKERDQLVSAGVVYEERTHEQWMVSHEPLEIFHSSIATLTDRVVRYKKWVAGVAVALSNYHYDVTAEMAVTRKKRVEALLSTWGNFCEQISLAESDPDIGEYLQPAILRVPYNQKLITLRKLHQKGVIYFIGRADDTVSERLFIKELALLHRRLFYGRPHTSSISDLFYLEGMKSAPTERAIQRIAKSAITNHKETAKLKSEMRS